jgi:hypothetical protein
MQMLKAVRSFGRNVALAVGIGTASVAMLPSVSLAADPDFAPITAAVDWGTVITGVLAVAALVAAVYVAVRGAKMLLGMIRS